LGPQLQGSLQIALTQAFSEGQSLSVVHSPMLMTGGVALQVPLPELMYPGGQTHIIVLTGRDGVTLQLAGLWQGSSSVQGFLHVPSKQANGDGQSES
jgi:hypothetical protein